jgi:hypothetical protein
MKKSTTRIAGAITFLALILTTFLSVGVPANAGKPPALTPGQKVLNAAIAALGSGPSLVMTSAQISAGEAWCSEFGSYVYTKGGAGNLFTLGTPGTAINTSTNKWVTWATANNRLRWSNPALKLDPTLANTLSDPLLTPNVNIQPGDLVMEWHWKTSTNAWSTHTAIVESVAVVNGRRVFNTVDGNWNGIVKRRTVDTDLKGKIFAVVSPVNV